MGWPPGQGSGAQSLQPLPAAGSHIWLSQSGYRCRPGPVGRPIHNAYFPSRRLAVMDRLAVEDLTFHFLGARRMQNKIDSGRTWTPGMRPPRGQKGFLFGLGTAVVLMFTVVSGGCSGDATTTSLDTGSLLDQYERDRRRHDPIAFSEVDLGEFTVSQRHEPHIFFIRFHLYGVIPDEKRDDFVESLSAHGERIRATVREIAQRTDLEQLSDPSLGAVKADMILAINRILPARLLRDVVFAEYSFERG